MLDTLGFLVDWHGSRPSGTQRKYRDMVEVDVDQEQLLAYYAASDDESVDYSQPHRVTELLEHAKFFHSEWRACVGSGT